MGCATCAWACPTPGLPLRTNSTAQERVPASPAQKVDPGRTTAKATESSEVKKSNEATQAGLEALCEQQQTTIRALEKDRMETELTIKRLNQKIASQNDTIQSLQRTIDNVPPKRGNGGILPPLAPPNYRPTAR